jgi:nucleoside-diphosphate-sugar epimerase
VTTIAITGVSGGAGQVVLRRLADDPSVTRIIGIDARDPTFRPPALEFHRLDLASADLKPLLEPADCLAHLSFLVAPRADAALIERVNVEGTRRVLDAAGGAGLGAVVVVSSAMVYGAWANNPVPLTEDAPLRPNPGVTFATQKAEIERLVAEWSDDHPGIPVAVMRPVTVVGPWVNGHLSQIFRDGLPVRMRDPGPPAQFVHHDDMAAAVHLAIASRLDGVFNVSPDGWIPHDQLLALAAPRLRVRLPWGTGGRVARQAWAAGIVEEPSALTPYLEHSWIVANDRLRAAGWEPQHTNEEAFVAAAEPSVFQDMSARRRQQLMLGAAAGGLVAAAGGAVALVRGARRRSRSS